MFLGTGKLEIRLMRADGTKVETIVPARPSERVYQDFDPVVTTLPANSFGRVREIVTGYQFRAVYRWISTSHNQTDMAAVQKIGNWRRIDEDRYIELWPHEDQPQIHVRCEVIRHTQTPLSGKVTADVIELELLGLDTVERKPNPLLDRVSKLHRRGSVNTTARVFGS